MACAGGRGDAPAGGGRGRGGRAWMRNEQAGRIALCGSQGQAAGRCQGDLVELTDDQSEGAGFQRLLRCPQYVPAASRLGHDKAGGIKPECVKAGAIGRTEFRCHVRARTPQQRAAARAGIDGGVVGGTQTTAGKGKGEAAGGSPGGRPVGAQAGRFDLVHGAAIEGSGCYAALCVRQSRRPGSRAAVSGRCWSAGHAPSTLDAANACLEFIDGARHHMPHFCSLYVLIKFPSAVKVLKEVNGRQCNSRRGCLALTA